jgi:lipoate synthase
MKTKKAKSIGDSFHQGWAAKSKKQSEFYRTILNDLAEDVEVRGRLTRDNLIQVCGYLSAECDRMNECYQDLNRTITDICLTAMQNQIGPRMDGKRQRDWLENGAGS